MKESSRGLLPAVEFYGRAGKGCPVTGEIRNVMGSPCMMVRGIIVLCTIRKEHVACHGRMPATTTGFTINALQRTARLVILTLVILI